MIWRHVRRNVVEMVVFYQKTTKEEKFEKVGIVTVTILVFRGDVGGDIVTCYGIDQLTGARALRRTTDKIINTRLFSVELDHHFALG